MSVRTFTQILDVSLCRAGAFFHKSAFNRCLQSKFTANDLFSSSSIHSAARCFHQSARRKLEIKCESERDAFRNFPYLEKLNETENLLLNDLTEADTIADLKDWNSKVFNYNVPHGKKIRGQIVLMTFHALSINESSIDWKLASILGWCVELLQAHFLVCDDMMDQSLIRRGQPCWYRNPAVGLCAINDSLFLNAGIYKILRKHFRSCKAYINILEEFLQVTDKTVSGQCLDMLSNPTHSRPRFEIFDVNRYFAIAECKTSHYSFRLPVHLAMHFVGKSSVHDFQISSQICLKLGLLFQIQDDFLDCYGAPEVIGKVGNDIQEGKCTWLSATFMEEASEPMKQEMMENYGVHQESAVSRVKDLYNELNMQSKYLKTQTELHNEIICLIEQVHDKNLALLFHNLLELIKDRKK